MSNPILHTPVKRPSTTMHSAVDEQIEYCRKIPGYSCGVFCDSEYFATETLKYLEHNLIQGTKARKSKNVTIFLFENGSRIMLIYPCYRRMCYRFHGVIVDHMIDNDTFERNIIPMLIYKIEELDNTMARLHVAHIGLSNGEE